jgi:hypothetical protein
VIDTSNDRDWGPDPNTLAQIARRCGCVVQLGQTLHDGSRSWELSCPTHAAKVRLLASLAEYDSKDPELIRLAEKLASLGNGEPWKIAQVIHAFVRDGVAHLPEPREKFQPAMRTLALGIGDCDDTSRAVLALLRAAGLRGGLLTLGNPPRHVAAAVKMPNGFQWLDASLPARAGEHPIAAARRLGIKVRPDLEQLGSPSSDGGDGALNIPNILTVTGFSLGVAWAAGGPDWMGLASIVLDELDGYAAEKLEQRTEFGSVLDWASDYALTPMVWQRMGLPWKFYPPVAIGQVSARVAGVKPDRFVPSVRAGLMLWDMGRRWIKRSKSKRRRRR